MSEELIKIADAADVIVNGYAFKLKENCITFVFGDEFAIY